MNDGKIFLVGFGPGAGEHMSYRAREAIAESDVVIGYSTYIKLVADLLEGKEVVRKGMTEEIDRCLEAYEQARLGKTVALVSSGDIGVYGMAGPTYEVLLQSGWRPGDGIEVEVVPGSTALSACAALVGAPLTHDFCAISLSDLMTPWPVIERRLEAAGRGDFVVALYNPKSGRRTGQIVEARRILLKHRHPDTPVAIVKSAYRKRQNIQHTTLAEMADCDIGMLSTVLVGNSSSFFRAGLMITPRGYASKYDELTGEVKEGEQAGRSLSMGLEGWKTVVRHYLRDHPESDLEQTARRFEMAPGAILTAIAESDESSPAAPWRAERLPWGELQERLTAFTPLHLCSQSHGMRLESRLSTAAIEVNDEALTIRSEGLMVTLPRSSQAVLWQLHRGETATVFCVDEEGQTLFALHREETEPPQPNG